MKKLIYIATLLTAMVMVGCEKFEDPKPYQAWTDEMIIADGYQIVSGPRTTGDGYYESCVVAVEGNLIELTE